MLLRIAKNVYNVCIVCWCLLILLPCDFEPISWILLIHRTWHCCQRLGAKPRKNMCSWYACSFQNISISELYITIVAARIAHYEMLAWGLSIPCGPHCIFIVLHVEIPWNSHPGTPASLQGTLSGNSGFSESNSSFLFGWTIGSFAHKVRSDWLNPMDAGAVYDLSYCADCPRHQNKKCTAYPEAELSTVDFFILFKIISPQFVSWSWIIDFESKQNQNIM